MRAALLIVTLLCSWLSFESRVAACKCMEPDLARSYDGSDHVVHARVVQLWSQTSTTRTYLARLVAYDYKGCLASGRRVLIETPSSSAACGVTLQIGTEYLLLANRVGALVGTPRLRVGLCGGNKTWSSVSPEQLDFLTSRYVCCGGSCGCTDGTQPVNCFVDPCEVSSCEVEGAVCNANYCGGCRAEWRDASGAAVCEADTTTCDYSAPGRTYISRNPDRCAAIRFTCAAGSAPFFDDCGCGCEVEPNGCKVGGCSSQLCVEPGDPGISTCEWREEYACYRSATCERQPAGNCGFTPTAELEACLGGAR